VVVVEVTEEVASVVAEVVKSVAEVVASSVVADEADVTAEEVTAAPQNACRSASVALSSSPAVAKQSKQLEVVAMNASVHAHVLKSARLAEDEAVCGHACGEREDGNRRQLSRGRALAKARGAVPSAWVRSETGAVEATPSRRGAVQRARRQGRLVF
jgi:hypothetical protein